MILSTWLCLGKRLEACSLSESELSCVVYNKPMLWFNTNTSNCHTFFFYIISTSCKCLQFFCARSVCLICSRPNDVRFDKEEEKWTHNCRIIFHIKATLTFRQECTLHWYQGRRKKPSYLTHGYSMELLMSKTSISIKSWCYMLPQVAVYIFIW